MALTCTLYVFQSLELVLFIYLKCYNLNFYLIAAVVLKLGMHDVTDGVREQNA